MNLCVLCGFPLKARPMYGDNAHNALETCITNLRAALAERDATIARLTPTQAAMPFEGPVEAQVHESYEASV